MALVVVLGVQVQLAQVPLDLVDFLFVAMPGGDHDLVPGEPDQGHPRFDPGLQLFERVHVPALGRLRVGAPASVVGVVLLGPVFLAPSLRTFWARSLYIGPPHLWQTTTPASIGVPARTAPFLVALRSISAWSLRHVSPSRI